MFTLNTNLIPNLNRNMISFRYIGGIYDPATIIITCKTLDVCRVDINRDINKPYNYDVFWFGVFSGIGSLRREYEISEDLVADIKKAIEHLKNRGENKMNNKLYRVTDMRVTSSVDEKDELTFTVIPVILNSFGLADCDRIKEAIESLGERNTYIFGGRGNGKTKMLMNSYFGGFTTWRNEYQKERDKFEIKDVIFNNPATIVLWADGTKTVVKAENEEFDPEKGLAMAIAKKALGNNYDYYDIFKKYVGRYEKKNKKGGK